MDVSSTNAATIHIGRSEQVAQWLLELGVVPVDTSSFARNDDWERLAALGRGVADGTQQAALGAACRRRDAAHSRSDPAGTLFKTVAGPMVRGHLSPTTTMTAYHHLSTENADRQCGACGDRQATAYVHDAGFRCGECADVPDELREHDAAEDGTDPQRNGSGRS